MEARASTTISKVLFFLDYSSNKNPQGPSPRRARMLPGTTMSDGQPPARPQQSLDDKFKRIDVALDVKNKAIVAAWVLPEDELFLQT